MHRYYARKLIVKKIDDQIATDFLIVNHRQADAKTAYKLQSLGIFDGDELLGVAVFSTPRTEKMRRKYTVELLRMAFRKNARVVGGASKLIRYFIEEYKPSDIFTYQDTAGENTRVYEHSGMVLVKDGSKSKKQYLVAPGKTLETASRRESFGMAYAVRYGPDRIIGTKLGEIFDEQGKRKSNRRIFLEELGWHIEETTADSIYEWIDPDRTYYTYRITARDSSKYYYGVSHVKKAHATVEDCLTDGYWGSGGAGGAREANKFRNWRTAHRDFLQKEILGRFRMAAPAYVAEGKLIGDLWRNDPLCLNSTAGGRSGGAFTRRQSYELGFCIEHGETKLRNGKCAKCWVSKRWSKGDCELHGAVNLRDGICVNCKNLSTVVLKACPKHGRTKHQGDICPRCRAESQLSKRDCEIHGKDVVYVGEECASCRNTDRIRVLECELHGVSKHIGDRCYKCFSGTQEKTCEIHGLTKHNGEACLKCTKAKSISRGNCPIHGEVKFSGNSCITCENQKAVSVQICPVHGEVKFQGDRCSSCTNGSLISLKICEKHGETKHRGNSCYKCVGERRKKQASRA